MEQEQLGVLASLHAPPKDRMVAICDDDPVKFFGYN